MADRERLRFADGREIDVLQLGDPAGVPALYLHGTPSSAREAQWLASAASAAGVRLIAPDRPGYLNSDLPAERSLLGAAQDLVRVPDLLALRRYAVVGFSGGAAFALAVAWLATERVTVVHIGGGIGPIAGEAAGDLPWQRRVPFRLASSAPWLVGPLLGPVFALLRRGVDKRIDRPREAARWFFDGPARGAQVPALASYIESTPADELRDELRDFAKATQATRAIVDDLTAYTLPWPLQLNNINTPVELWHGRDDPAAPVGSAERIAAALPDCIAHTFHQEGHFVFHSHAMEIVTSIAAHAQD